MQGDSGAGEGSGRPIWAEGGRWGGYVTGGARPLPPLNFTAAEMVAMAVSLASAEATPFASALRSALRKVLAAAPAARAAEAAQLMDRVRLIGAAGTGNSRSQCPAGAAPDAAGGC